MKTKRMAIWRCWGCGVTKRAAYDSLIVMCHMPKCGIPMDRVKRPSRRGRGREENGR